MELPLILAAGVAKHPWQLIPYLRSDMQIGAVTSGSYTHNDRKGNEGNLVWPADFEELMQSGFALNAYGMPNVGLARAMELFPENPVKPHLVSIAGFSADHYISMLEKLKECPHIVGAEVNGGCPNTGHLPVAYVLDDLAHLLAESARVKFNKPIWLKLSPYMTREELSAFAKMHSRLNFEGTPVVGEEFVRELSELLIEYAHVIRAVVMTNTIPNVAFGDAITVRNEDGSYHHRGGLSGPLLREHNLKLIRQMVGYGVADTIDIVGCGGALTGDDALSYLREGCVAVAFNSGPNWGGPRFFGNLLEGSDALQEALTTD